ncbi:hypothetical protein E3Q14_00827 [Wallemia mellicola]|nr:hypothetical protein E3Q14_00827 [Wallemia mellicola]TIC58503.1 hypothetical protein E3Q05_00819 [Wallemia mellicola]
MTNSETPPVDDLLIAVFNSVLEVIVLCLCGYFLATRKIIDKPATRLLNKLNVDLFTPALLFSKVAFSLSPSKLKELHVIPIGFVLITSASALSAYLLGRLVGLNKRQRNFAIACGAFQNSNSLPIALMQSLVATVPHLKWTAHDTKETMLGRSLTYLVVYSTLGQILRWSWGVRLLAAADESEDNRSISASEEATVFNDTTAADTDPAAAFTQNSHIESAGNYPNITLSPSAPSSSAPSPVTYTNDQKLSPKTTHPDIGNPPPESYFHETADESDQADTLSSDDSEWGLPSGTGKVSTLQRIWKKTSKRMSRLWSGFISFMTPPLWAAFISLVIALIRPLQAVLAKATPLRGAIKSAGNVSVPLTLVVLGAYFYSSSPETKPTTIQASANHIEGDLQRSHPSFVSSVQSFFTNGVSNITKARTHVSKDKRGERRTIFVAVVARMIITPAMLLPLFLWDDLTRNDRILDDPVFIVSACLLIGSPPALTLAQLTQATSGDAFEKLISKTLFISYALITPITSIIIVALGKASTSKDDHHIPQSIDSYDNPVAPWLSSNQPQNNTSVNYMPPDTPPLNKVLSQNKSTPDLSERSSLDHKRASGEHKRKGWKHLLKSKPSTTSVHPNDRPDTSAGTSNESPALSRAASKADLTKESQPFATLPDGLSSSKQQRKPQSSQGKSTEKRPEVAPGDPGFVLDTDLTHMEGILAGHKDQPKRSKRHGSSSTAGNSSASSVKNTTSSGSSSRAQRNGRRSEANQPPMTIPTPAFLTGQFDLEPLPRSKRPRAQKSTYSTSPRTMEPPQLAPSLSMSPPSPVKSNTRKGSSERGDSKFPANSKWRINPPPSDYDIPKRLGGKRSGPPSPRQPDHVQLGGIKTSISQTQSPPTLATDNNVTSSGWQAPESWGIVQEPANHNEEYESETSEENEGDGYYDDDDNHQRRVSNYFDFNPKEDNWNGAFGEAATWGSPAFQRTSADQNSGVRPIKLKALEHNDPSSAEVNDTRSRQESNASGGQIQHLTAEQSEPAEMGEDIRKASLRRVSSAKRQGSPGMQRPSTAGSASQHGSRGPNGNYCIRIYKSDEDLERLIALRILHVNSNKIQVLPAELGKIAKLHVLDVGSNVLKYNIANWGYDWNWNWNLDLRYLNFSGNKRLEIREVKDYDRHSNAPGTLNLAEFSNLKELRVLGLMDVTLRVPSLPDESENRRVRTSFSNINNMAYGIADSIGNLENLSMSDFVVPRFRGKENECLFGFFDGKVSTSANGCHLSKYLHDSFEPQLNKELSRLGPGDDIPDALRRAFLRLNKKFFDTTLPSLVGVRRKTSNYSDVVPLSNLLNKSSSKSDSRKTSQVSANSVMAVVSTPTGTAKDAPEMGMFEVKSGAAAIVVYIVDKTMHVANAGDSLAVISRSGSPRVVSTKHEPLARPETARIRAAEGWVTPGGKVNDELDVSKSLGFYHLQPAVNARPAVHTITLTDMDEFVIVANKSLWDYISYQTAVDIARTTRDDVMTAAQKLRDFAIAYGAQGNLMVMVVSVADIFRPKHLPSSLEGNEDDYYGGLRRTGQRRRGDEAVVGDRTLARLDREVSPPVGHVTLVFTDIRNSTILWESNRGMQSAMRIHNHLLRRHLRTIGGYEVKTEGDAFMVSFQTVTSALLWCFTVQLQLLSQDWPKEILETDEGRPLLDANGNSIARGLSVRMGIHVGYPVCEADPVTQRMDYWGPVVNRASRVAAAAEGGQIMASGDVVSELQHFFSLDPNSPESETGMSNKIKSEVASLRRIGFGVSTVGERRLKGLEVPEHLSLLYPIQLRGRLQLDKNIASTAGQHEPSTSVFESTPPILHADELRRLAKLVVKIESLAGGKIQKEPTEMPEKDEDEKVESESTHPQHFVQLDTDNEDDNEGDSSTKDKGAKALSRHTSHKDKNDLRDKEKEVFAVVPANLLAPAIPDAGLDLPVSRTRSHDAVYQSTGSQDDRTSGSNIATTSSNRTFMSNIFSTFRNRSSSHSAGLDEGSRIRGTIRRQLSKRKSPPATAGSSDDGDLDADLDDSGDPPADKDGPSYKIRLLPHLENSRSPNFAITTRQMKPNARLKVGRFSEKAAEEDADKKGLMGGGGRTDSLRLAFKSKVVSRSHAEISVNTEAKFFLRDTGSSSGTFLNHRRLSGSTQASKPYEIRDGDIIQLGVDYQGGTDPLYRCVKIRVELGDKMKSPVAFHARALEQVKELSSKEPNVGSYQSDNNNDNDSLDCAICLFPVDLEEDNHDEIPSDEFGKTPANNLAVPCLNGVRHENSHRAEDLTLGLVSF